MKLDAEKFALATALAFALLWIVCASAVGLLPEMMMQVTGHMVHMDASAMQWHISVGGFFLGMLAWSFFGGITAWLIAFIYNLLLRRKDTA